MRAEKIGNQNFGMRITDNFEFQQVCHFLVQKSSPKPLFSAIQKARMFANDSFELTFKEFAVGKPCEIQLRKNMFPPKKIFVLYGEQGTHSKGSGKQKSSETKSITTEKLFGKIMNMAKRYVQEVTK